MTNTISLSELKQNIKQARKLEEQIMELEVSAEVVAELLNKHHKAVESVDKRTVKNADIIKDALSAFKVLGEQSLKDMKEVESILEITLESLKEGYLKTTEGTKFLQASEIIQNNLLLATQLGDIIQHKIETT